MKRGLALEASVAGISEVLRKPDGPAGEVALLLGCAKNAAAAIDGDIPGLNVSHIVCVASGKNARLLEARCRGCRANPVVWQSFTMHDRLSSEDTVDISSDLARPLVAINGAICPQGVPSTLTRAVLVHCNMGHNRAPALVLAYLVSCGMTLHDAYRQVLRARPSVDPLPPYREGLRAFELARNGSSTIFGDEHFAMHISQLAELVERTCCTGVSSSDEDTDTPVRSSSGASTPSSDGSSSEDVEKRDQSRVFDMAIAKRERSIKNLLEEVPKEPS
mmetsp:Transcript_53412/g.106276  ORF Transcript_53412/g.106276 Transcript_53412/m.106276 type:complete len:276 (+) Transcript_53412:84-911(+)